MAELSRHPEKSTEELRALDGEFELRHRTIMEREDLVPAAKQRHLEELRKEYAERWVLAADAAKRDLEEWAEIFQSRAESARQPKMPEDKDARILKALELQRLHNLVDRHKDQPGRLLAEYERLLKQGDAVLAFELEEAIPDLLPAEARADFRQRVSEERQARMSEEDKKRVAEYEEWQRQASAVAQGLYHQEANRQRGYTPAPITPTTLITHHRGGGRLPEVDEVPNPRYRDYGDDRPSVSQPQGGVIVPDPGGRE